MSVPAPGIITYHIAAAFLLVPVAGCLGIMDGKLFCWVAVAVHQMLYNQYERHGGILAVGRTDMLLPIPQWCDLNAAIPEKSTCSQLLPGAFLGL